MKNKKNHYAINFFILALVSLTLIVATQAQSNDIDNPTPLTSKIIDGEGDGTAETIYYSFMAGKGEVKITVDAKTDDRSTPLRVALLDEDGKELLPIYVVAKGSGSREVGTKRFVRDTKVLLKIRMDDDRDVKLLTYKIKLDGAVKIDTLSIEQPTNSPLTTNANASANAATTTESTTHVKKEKTIDKIKKKVKDKSQETREKDRRQLTIRGEKECENLSISA